MTLMWAGLALGALYALVAALFNIAMSQSGVFNFAVPQSVMVGAFLAFEFTHRVDGPLLLTLPLLCLAVGAGVGYLTELLAIRPVVARGGHGVLITTVGIAFVLEGAAFARYGVDGSSVDFLGLSRNVDFLGGRLALVDVALMVAAVVIIVGLWFVTRRTRWGLEGRAVTMDTTSAALRGVNSLRNRAQVFMLAGALGCLVGLLAGVKVHASYDLGIALLVYAFVAFAVGGIGSFPGCLVGGVLVGLLQAYSARYVGAEYSLMFAFVVLLGTLLIRPTGLWGSRQLRLV